MKRILRKIFNIREGEGLKSILMFSYIFSLIASLMILKPVRNSIFLSHLGINHLPYAFILVAFTSGIVVYYYLRFSKKFQLNYLIVGTLLTSLINLLIFAILFHLDVTRIGFFYLFYIWVALYGVITTTQFWLLANYVFNAREAKRLFGFIGAGGILGGIVGGYLTNYLAPVIGTPQMIFTAIFFVGTSLILMVAVWKKAGALNYKFKMDAQKRLKQQSSDKNPFKLIRKSNHLFYTALLVGIGVIVANLVDYQYNAIASELIVDEDQLTAFFGFWFSNLSILAIIFQFFLTGRLLKHIGVIRSLFFLPIGVFVGTVATFINPALWSAIFIKVSEGGLKQSVNKAGMELLALPVPPLVKNKAMPIIGIFVDSLATGLGGLLLIAITASIGLPIQYISIIIFIFIIVWLFTIGKMKAAYLNSFRTAIEKRTFDFANQSINFSDSTLIQNMIEYLNSDNERQILYVLTTIEGVDPNLYKPHIPRLLNHSSERIRIKTIKILTENNTAEFKSEIEKLIFDNHQDVRVAAIRYLFHLSDDPIETLRHYYNHTQYDIQMSAVHFATKESDDNNQLINKLDIEGKLNNLLMKTDWADHKLKTNKDIKLNIARIIGRLKTTEYNSILIKLLNDKSVDVIKEAADSIGRIRQVDLISELIPMLGNREALPFIRKSLAEYSENAVEYLINYMNDAMMDFKIRIRIPKTLALIGSIGAVNALHDGLESPDRRIRFEIIRSLNKLKDNYPMAKLDTNLIDQSIVREAEGYLRVCAITYRLDRHSTNIVPKQENNKLSLKPARKLLIRALQEDLNQRLEKIFRLMGLRYGSKDIYNAYLGVISGKPNLRSDAVEFLDNILASKFKKYIIPIVELKSLKSILRKCEQILNLNLKSTDEGLEVLLKSNDYWLVACTVNLIADQHNRKFKPIVNELIDSDNRIVSETASYARARLE